MKRIEIIRAGRFAHKANTWKKDRVVLEVKWTGGAKKIVRVLSKCLLIVNMGKGSLEMVKLCKWNETTGKWQFVDYEQKNRIDEYIACGCTVWHVTPAAE